MTQELLRPKEVVNVGCKLACAYHVVVRVRVFMIGHASLVNIQYSARECVPVLLKNTYDFNCSKTGRLYIEYTGRLDGRHPLVFSNSCC